MSKWRMAKSLLKLRSQLDVIFPNRSKVSDGGIGDAAHRARKSDHNPNAAGIVTAFDFTNDKNPADGVGINCDLLLNALLASKDPRIKYLIFERKIYNERDGFTPRKYSGVNAHEKHLHLSVKSDEHLVDSEKEWNLNAMFANSTPKPPPAPVTVLRKGDKGEGVRQLQGALANAGLLRFADIDGDFGPKTEKAVRAFQQSKGLQVDGVAGAKTRAALG